MNTSALNEEQIEAGYISTTKYTKAQIDEAYNYLLNNSQGETFIDAYKEDMTAQSYFTSTKEQFNNSNYNPNSSVGLEDSSFETIPLFKTGITTIKAGVEVVPSVFNASKIVVNKTGQVYDDVTLGTINQFNNVAPNLTSKYLGNPVKITENGLDYIGSILPGIPENNKWGSRGFLTGYAIEKYIQYKINQEEVNK